MDHFPADDGERIHLRISGQGRPLVLLHGWTSTHRDWTPFMPALEAGCRVFRWDARGHGGHAPRNTAVPTVARMARDLHNLIRHYGLQDVAIAGHSMGALTLWQYLRDWGEEGVSHLAFIDQSPRLLTDAGWRFGIYGDFDANRNAAFMDELREDLAEAVLRLAAFGKNARARDKYLENGAGIQLARQRLAALDPQPLIDCWASLTAADYRDVLQTITLPSFLVYGDESNFYSVDTARHVAGQIAGSRLQLYAGQDHAPHLGERERFVRELRAFLGLCGAAAGCP